MVRKHVHLFQRLLKHVALYPNKAISYYCFFQVKPSPEHLILKNCSMILHFLTVA